MTLVEFLQARLAEDEEVASHEDGGLMFDAHFSKPRVLAECEAKRRIVEGMPSPHDDQWGEWDRVVRLLAVPFAEHPDYHRLWKP